MDKLKTGILGGTFDPIHNAHLIIAEYAREQAQLDSVWLMVSGNPPHKRKKKVTDAKIRMKMTELAASDDPFFEICSYEAERTEYSYTAQTLVQFNKMYPDREFYFIIGADSLQQMDKWYKPEVIARNCVLLVYARRGTDDLDWLVRKRAESYGADIRIINAPMIDISSSLIRKRVSEGRSVRHMLPHKVMDVIEKEGLYRDRHGTGADQA